MASSESCQAQFSTTIKLLRDGSLQFFETTAVRIQPLSYKEGPYSRVLRVCISGASKCIIAYIKLYKVRSTSPAEFSTVRQRVADDFDILRLIFQALAGQACLSTARPIACFPEELSMVTEEAPGATIRSILNRPVMWRWASAQENFLHDIFGRVGSWVRVFQATGVTGNRLSIPEMRSYIEVRLNALVGAGVFTPVEAPALLARFDAYADQVSTSDLTEVRLHADLCPDNVLATERLVSIIDISSSANGSLYYDLAHMFTHLEKLKVRPWIGAHVIERLQASMLKGFDAALDSQRPLFQIELMRNILSQLLQLHSSKLSAVGRFYSTLIWRANHARVQNWING